MASKQDLHKGITISAPAKIHLLGEHAVVYNKPALLSAINLRASITIFKGHPELDSGSKEIPLSKNTTDQVRNDKMVKQLRKVLETIIKKQFKLKTLPEYYPVINSQIPIGSGLGSSAAISAAYIGALLTFLKFQWDLNLINELTYRAEKVFHGNPSGADNTTVVMGGTVWYRKEFEGLKLFSPNVIKVHKKFKNFLLIDSGKPKENTRDMVVKVSESYQKSVTTFNRMFSHQEQLVKDLTTALRDGDEKKMMDSIKSGERNLEKIGVVGKGAKVIIGSVEAIGGVAKILGAGGFEEGSGMILAYSPNLQKLIKLSKDNNYSIYQIKLGEQGLK